MAIDGPDRAADLLYGLGDAGGAQLSTLSGGDYCHAGPCLACGLPVPVEEELEVVAVWRGSAARPKIVAVAHARRWVGPGDDDYDDRCANVLRARWYDQVAAGGAGLLCLRADGGRPRFFLGDIPLHAGTPIDVLCGDGTWLRGRFEYICGPGRWRPRFHLVLGGEEFPETGMDIPVGTVVRPASGIGWW